MKKKLKVRNLIIGFILLLLAMAFYSVGGLSETFFQLPMVYQARDINRSIELFFNGKWIWYGPDLTGGGHLPGPFFYWLLGIPLTLFKTIESVLIFEYFLAALHLSIICYFLKRKFSTVSAWLFFLIFINSLYFNVQLYLFWNPSFIYLFLSLAVGLLIEGNSRKHLAISAFIIGLSIQVHFSMVILLAPVALLILRSKEQNRKERLIRLTLVVFFASLPIMPYLFFGLSKGLDNTVYDSMGAGVDRFLIRFSMLFLHPERNFTMVKLKWFFSLFTVELWLIPSIISFFCFRQDLFKKSRYLFYAAATAVTGVAILLILIGQPRYSSVVLWIMSLVAAIYLPRLLLPKRKFYVFAIFALLVTIYNLAYRVRAPFDFMNFLSFAPIVFLILAFIFFKYFITEGSDRRILSVFCVLTFVNLSFPALLTENAIFTNGKNINSATGKKLVKEIVDTTGWDYTYYRQHTLMTTVHCEFDLSLFYDLAYKENANKPSPTYDGVLISSEYSGPMYKQTEPTIVIDHETVKNFFPPEIFTLMERGQIECLRTAKVGILDLCYYIFKKDYPVSRLNNIGYVYLYNNKSEFPVNKSRGVHVASAKEATFYINSCETLEEACSVFFKMNIMDFKLHLTVTGDPLASVYPIQHPAWGWRIDQPKFKVRCNGQDSEVLIANKMGYDATGLRDAFVAPFDAVYPLPCSNPSSIKLIIGESRSTLRGDLTSSDYGQVPPVDMEWQPGQTIEK